MEYEMAALTQRIAVSGSPYGAATRSLMHHQKLDFPRMHL